MTLIDSEQLERRPGRPRSARADRAILQATVDLLVEEGFQAMSIEGIAERAGVGKTTIYRRFDSKEEIVIAALSTMAGEIRIPDTGDTRQDLLLLGQAFRDQSVTSIIFPVMRHIVGTALTNPAVFEAFRTNLLDPRQAAFRTIIERGVERGDLRPDIDIDLLVDLIPGGIFFHVLFKLPPGAPPAHDFTAWLLDDIWRGIAAR
jgi:AcrR family transcriptional regulator